MSARDLLLTEEPPARRGFLRSLVMAPVAALATHRLILPGEASPEERARRAWREFSDAMSEITAQDYGWKILAGERKPFRDLRNDGAWMNLRAIVYVPAGEPLYPSHIVERHRELAL